MVTTSGEEKDVMTFNPQMSDYSVCKRRDIQRMGIGKDTFRCRGRMEIEQKAVARHVLSLSGNCQR